MGEEGEFVGSEVGDRSEGWKWEEGKRGFERVLERVELHALVMIRFKVEIGRAHV